ncbi:glucan endo-1,3-beta-glucosidase 11-like [Dioscorea cayenensis subsp. rotundata]|uniref:glucan endo-1,3-beta-D-glucosidase n=1 Tax=Dioscorea cayennensis subsp. rotundata TaxID=55577 RepID=A0AB40B7A0_DIOCR|nr:glucan endo-1,3-beta-glucosidase 11-like [Dioscorea cayenensis subsp. rotundata]
MTDNSKPPTMAAVPILLLLSLLLHCATRASALSSSPVGVNYGLVADNLPSPTSVGPLLASINVGRVKLYDTDSAVLSALSTTGFELIVGLPDRCVVKLADPSAALVWVKANLQPHLPAAKIAAVTVGNEVLTGNDTAVMAALVPAMRSLRSALDSLGLRSVAVTTPHSLAILANSFPPSAGRFRQELIPYLCPLLDFLAETGSPFFINAYPYFAYKAEPDNVTLNYALFEPNPGVLDPGSGLKYENMLDAQVDAVYAAISAATGGKGKGLEVRVSETGWPSDGDENEVGATAANAAKYNGNLMKMVAEGKGTPARPSQVLRVYVFALFNENLKPGPKSERNYGLFKPDGTPAYDLGIKPETESPTTSGGGSSGGRGGGSSDEGDGSSSSGYYSISAAAAVTRGREWLRGMAMMVGLVVLVS